MGDGGGGLNAFVTIESHAIITITYFLHKFNYFVKLISLPPPFLFLNSLNLILAAFSITFHLQLRPCLYNLYSLQCLSFFSEVFLVESLYIFILRKERHAVASDFKIDKE